MKKSLLKIICLVALTITYLPTVANDYLKIYFKDGHTERHYMHLVECIYATKYDLDGNLHNDYQMQQIVMADTTYSYYLADIDSMSFKKVYEDQLKSDVETVSKTVTPIFEQCSTAEEMEDCIEDIRNIEGVEDVWQTGTGIVVQIRDWHKIYFVYPEILEESYDPFANIETKLRAIRRQIPQKQNPLKVAIAFQMIDDSRFSEEKGWLMEISERFKAMGFETVFIPNEETGEILDIDFYERRMYDYDIVLIETHGSYLNGVHSLFTSERTEFLTFLDALDNETGDDIDDIDIGCCHTGKYSSWVFKTISENFIKKTNNKFKGDGPHIVFVGACEVLKGNNILTREHNGESRSYYGSDAVAKIFFDKGVDVFLSYNKSTCYACGAACQYFEQMLNGCSQEAAFYYLNDYYKDEVYTSDQAALIDLINPNSQYANPKSIYLFKTQTEEKTQQEIAEEYKNTNRVELKAVASCYDFNKSKLSYGFRLGKVPNVDTLEEYDYQELFSENMHYSETEEGTVEFSVIANPYPEMDIYYRAFTYDGIHYNWGEERHFIVYNNLAISATSISIKEGETSTIYITSGSGQYGVTNLGGSIASATLQGTTIQIKGLSIGNAEVVVTDILSGQQIIIKVYVKKKEEPSTSPEAIDLGLTSRTLWASYNIGATKPEELGAFLAWGEIEEKDYYDTNTYLYNNIELGKNIAGTNYDVAHILWGGAWVMPTQEQLKELFNYCKIEWTTIDGTKGCILTGPNGNNIFMPVGGWKEDDEVYQAESGNYWSSESTGGWFFDETYGTSSLSSPVYRGLLVRPVQIGEYKDVPAPAIDMGLPSGTKWAQYNVGAVNWEDCGGYYAWGETEEKSIYSWDTYEHCDGTGNSLHNIGDNIVGTEYDVAHVRWGGDWRMPTDEDYQELFDNCTFVFGKTKNNVVGIQFTGPNGNKLFFPAAGYRSNETLLSKSSYGRYWSGQLLFKIEEYPYNESIYSHSFEFSRSSSTLRLYSMQRSYGYSVRPVTK